MVGTPLVPTSGQKCLLLSPTPESRQARSPDEPCVRLWLPDPETWGESSRERWAGRCSTGARRAWCAPGPCSLPGGQGPVFKIIFKFCVHC